MFKRFFFMFGIIVILVFFVHAFFFHAKQTKAQNPHHAKGQEIAKQKEDKILKERELFASQKVVFLTFDDGPTKYTSQILDLLKMNNVYGTFFLIGNQIGGNEEIIKRIVNEGNVVGLHSMTHKPDILFSNPNIYINEFVQEQQLLASLGIKTSISRSPYGSKPYIKQSYRDLIADAHLKLWDWTIDSNDWRFKNNTNQIINEVQHQIKRQHEVVLMHDQVYTLHYLPAVIKMFKDKGYVFEAYNSDLNYSVNFWNDMRL